MVYGKQKKQNKLPLSRSILWLLVIYLAAVVVLPLAFFSYALPILEGVEVSLDAGPQQDVVGRLYDMMSAGVIVYMIAVAAALLFIFFRLFTPLKKMERILHGIVAGNVNDDLEELAAGSPLRSINMDIKVLLNNLRETAFRESTTVLLKKQAELDALQSQINPHFLYNTLDTIRGQANAHGLKDVEMMSLALSRLFRYSISNHNSFVPLSEELVNIDNYLLIQHLRFGNKFNVVKRIDKDTLDQKIPKLLIQPLVENAIYHGLEPKVNGGTLLISAYLTNERLIINIQDDGIGIGPAKLDEINESLSKNVAEISKKSGRTSIGLYNVNARIKLLFGREYGIHVLSTDGVGTNIQLSLPAGEDSNSRPSGL